MWRYLFLDCKAGRFCRHHSQVHTVPPLACGLSATRKTYPVKKRAMDCVAVIVVRTEGFFENPRVEIRQKPITNLYIHDLGRRNEGFYFF